MRARSGEAGERCAVAAGIRPEECRQLTLQRRRGSLIGGLLALAGCATLAGPGRSAGLPDTVMPPRAA